MARVIRMLLRLDVPDLDERTPEEIAAAVAERLTWDCAGTWTSCSVWTPVVEEEG